MIPSPGRVVLYELTRADAAEINKRRADFGAYRRDIDYRDTGHVAHAGNPVSGGESYPAVIVRVWADGESAPVNLQVLLDGSDTFWATSRGQGDAPGQWREPPRR